MSLELKLIALAVAVLALLGGWEWQKHEWTQAGVAQCQAVTAAAVAKQQAAASAVESQWERKVDDLRRTHEAELGSIAADRDTALASLHNRAPRRVLVPGAAASSCAGSTGADLSKPDSEFLVGLATRADQLRAALGQCQDWLKAVTQE